jgi:hypothetical protein
MATSALASSPSSGKKTAGSRPWQAPFCRHEISVIVTSCPPALVYEVASVTFPPKRDRCLTVRVTLGRPLTGAQVDAVAPPGAPPAGG